MDLEGIKGERGQERGRRDGNRLYSRCELKWSADDMTW